MTPDEADLQIAELERSVERLRSLYEQYFLGIEKQEPLVVRKTIDRRIDELRRARLNNTARRFRLQNAISRYNTFAQYWMRICREIENGTYRRHRLRAERRFAAELEPPPPPAAPAPDAPVLSEPSARAPSPLPPTPGLREGASIQPSSRRGPRPPPSRPTPPRAAPPPRPSDEAKRLHRQLARESASTGVEVPSLATLEHAMRKTRAKLSQKHPNRRVEFRVVVKDGTPRVLPVVR